jgi:hypothetical protein
MSLNPDFAVCGMSPVVACLTNNDPLRTTDSAAMKVSLIDQTGL